MIKLLIFLILTVSSICASAQFYDVNLGLGLMNETPGRYQSDSNGNKSKGNNRMSLEAGGSYQLDEDNSWRIHGNLGLLWPGAEVSYISRQVYYLTSTLGYKFYDNIELLVGGGLYFTKISGDGGTASIRNGSAGNFTDFNIPEEASISRNVTLNIGVDYEFYEDVSFKLETFIFNPVNSRNRSLNLSLGLHYHFGDILWQD